jgi:hypothetical protein
MSELSNADAELVYKYLNDRVRGDVEAEAYDAALNAFDDLDALEAAADDAESAFSWEGITYEFQRGNRDRDELVPLAGVDQNEEPEIYDLAHEFGWLVVGNIREEIRTMQESAILSPREFVALVLDSEWDEQNAATLMDVSVGNFRGKKGTIAEKLDAADRTLTTVDRIRADE